MEPQDPPQRSGWIVIAAVSMVFAPLLYILSVGPVAWLSLRGYLNWLPDSALYVLYEIYAPIEMAFDASPGFASVLIWYLQLWVPFSYLP